MSGSDLQEKRILIVEDDDMNFIYLNQIFKSESVAIKRVKSGYDAIQTILNDSRFDLILMDIKLPDIDGIRVTQEIRKHFPGIPIIAQTADRDEHGKIEILEAGCSDIILKPFKKDDFLRIIYKYIF